MNNIKIKSNVHIRNKKRYLKLNRNQLLILDALLYDGSARKYIDSDNHLRYTEHMGVLDFKANKLQKIIISGETTREDEDDIDILLPKDLPNIYEYEFMFHTHPPTPKPGDRAKDGILYEFPSVNDIFHFIKYYNKGMT
jgi:hypothetical protein